LYDSHRRHRHPHSLPTRRSSDLKWGKPAGIEIPPAKNPVLEGYYADPDIIYSHKHKKYYLYPTSDGFDGWGGYYFKTFSSDNLKDRKSTRLNSSHVKSSYAVFCS